MVRGDRLFVRLLGGLAVARDHDFSDPIRFSTRKAGALLAFVVMSPQQAALREQVAALLWGSHSDPQARQSLRQALSFLRKDLRPFDLIDADASTIRLRPHTIWVDALELLALAASSDFDELARAAGLFQGEFLAGLSIEEESFEEWLQQQRQRFGTISSGVLEKYASQADHMEKGPQAIAAVERLLATDPLREDWQRLALRIYARHRGHNEALAQAERFAKLLRRELAVKLEPKTRELIEQIKQGALARITPAAAQMQPPDVTIVAPEQPRHAPAGSPANRAAPAEARVPIRAPMVWTRWARLRSSITARAGTLLVAATALPSALFLLAKGYPFSGPAPPVPPSVAISEPWQSPRRGSPKASMVLENGVVAIAVLPFTSNSDQADSSNAIADLITDELTTVLSSIKMMRVISRETAKTLRGQSIDTATIGAEFGVSYLLEGSASMRGNRLRVNVGLVDTTTGLRVWSQRFERGGEDRHAIQDEIVNSLGRQLQVEVARIEGERPATDPDVHALIARGWAKLFAKGRLGKDGLQAAETLFMQALERDANNAQAQLGLGGYHVNMAVSLIAADAAAHLTKAEAILQSLIERHPNLAGAHSFMGLAHVARGRNLEAKGSFERAIELNPSHAPSYGQLGRVLARLGQPEQGLEHIQYAMRLSPRDPGMGYWLAFAGLAELELKRYDKAVTHLERALALNPGQPRTMVTLIASLALLGNMGEAHRRLEKLQRALPHLSRETLIGRFGSGRRDSQFQQGLRLALGPAPEGPPPIERLSSKHEPKP